METTKKRAIVVIEFDDHQENFTSTTDFATYMDGVMRRDLPDCDVTVYSTVEDLVEDMNKGLGPYAASESSKTKVIPVGMDEEFETTPKM